MLETPSLIFVSISSQKNKVMAESASHIRLVNALVRWISKSYFNGETGSIFIDSPDSSLGSRPPRIYNYTPDVLVPPGLAEIFIIGEAKTPSDLETNHSMEQFVAFIKKCSEFDNSLFVLAVRWDFVRLGYSIVRHAQKIADANYVKVKVLEKLAG